MSIRPMDPPEPVRLVFELSRADNPRLYDELMRFPKGAKRVNRVRVLAYDGLLAQHGVLAMTGPTAAPEARVEPVLAAAMFTNAVFAPALVE